VQNVASLEQLVAMLQSAYAEYTNAPSASKAAPLRRYRGIYEIYVQTPHWIALRDDARARANGRCTFCGTHFSGPAASATT
jgi:5-methylcytosine-specific restriction endonuclease McrA